MKNKNYLLTLEETNKLVAQSEHDSSKSFIIAADAELLKKVKSGNWIGATSNYFYTKDGGVYCQDKLMVTVIDSLGVKHVEIANFDKNNIRNIAKGMTNGLSFVCIPAFSSTLVEFSANSSSYEGIFEAPVVGWVAGMGLTKQCSEQNTPLVINGKTQEILKDGAVALRLELSKEYYPDVSIVNIFEKDERYCIELVNGDDATLSLTKSSCTLNGKPFDICEFMTTSEAFKNVSVGKMPFIGDFNGASLNVSVKKVEGSSVELYAPMFKGVKYYLARGSAEPYAKRLQSSLSKATTTEPVFSCNCILNHIHGDLQGKTIENMSQGPVTFGEIAYQLLNQTVVLVDIKKTETKLEAEPA